LRTEKSNRYYDTNKIVSNALELILLFPDYIQDIIAHGLSLIAIQDFKLNEKLRTIGTVNVLALYQSKLKRRTTDIRQNYHNAVNHLRLLSIEEQKLIAEKIIDMGGCIDFYMSDYEEVKTEIELNTKNVTSIRDDYIKWGPEKARETVNRMRMEIINVRHDTLRAKISLARGAFIIKDH